MHRHGFKWHIQKHEEWKKGNRAKKFLAKTNVIFSLAAQFFRDQLLQSYKT